MYIIWYFAFLLENKYTNHSSSYMKAYHFLFFTLIAMSIACKKASKLPETGTPPVVVVPKDTTKKDTTKVIVQPKRLKIDSIRKDLARKFRINILSDSVWRDSTGVSYLVELMEYLDDAVITLGPLADDSQIFAGSLVKGKSIADFSFKPLTGYALAPLDVLPSDWTFDIIDKMQVSKKTMDDYLQKQMSRSGTRQISPMYVSDGEAFVNYAEISIYQRYAWDFSNLLNLKAGEIRRIKKKTGFFSVADLFAFDIATHTSEEGNFFAPGVNPASVPDEPIIIRVVSYGRAATIAIESDASFDQVKAAFNGARTKNLSADHRSLLQNAKITTFARGFNANDVNQLKNLKGAELVEKYCAMVGPAASTISPKDYGAPINMMITKVDKNNNSFHKIRFKYRFDFPIK